MLRQIVTYANQLTLLVFRQAIEIKRQRELIEELKQALLGGNETFEYENLSDRVCG